MGSPETRIALFFWMLESRLCIKLRPWGTLAGGDGQNIGSSQDRSSVKARVLAIMRDAIKMDRLNQVQSKQVIEFDIYGLASFSSLLVARIVEALKHAADQPLWTSGLSVTGRRDAC